MSTFSGSSCSLAAEHWQQLRCLFTSKMKLEGAGVMVLVYIQDEVGRSWGYSICCISMIIAIVIFLSGTKEYRWYKKCLGSPISQIVQVIVAASRKKKMDVPCDVGMLFETNPEASRIQLSEQFRFLHKAAIVAEVDFENHPNSAANPWKLCTVTRVEEVKMMARLLPIWATTILFWTTYAQMITSHIFS